MTYEEDFKIVCILNSLSQNSFRKENNFKNQLLMIEKLGMKVILEILIIT